MKIYSEEKKLQFFFSEVGNAIWKYVARKKNFFRSEVGIRNGKFCGRKKLYDRRGGHCSYIFAGKNLYIISEVGTSFC